MNDGGESDLQLRVLEALESAHRYNRWVADLTLPFLGEEPLEIGSGIGVSAELWLTSGVPSITVTEINPGSLTRLQERFHGDARVTITTMDLEHAPEAQHSSVVALNVLEHIADDAGALRGAVRLVCPGGRIVIFVPAFPFATGKFDRQIGHYRRYTRDSVATVFAAAGIEVESTRYVNAPGLAAWFLGVRLLGLVPHDGRLLRTWDAVVVPLARTVEGRRSPPFGQSVLAVGRAPGAS